MNSDPMKGEVKSPWRRRDGAQEGGGVIPAETRENQGNLINEMVCFRYERSEVEIEQHVFQLLAFCSCKSLDLFHGVTNRSVQAIFFHQ